MTTNLTIEPHGGTLINCFAENPKEATLKLHQEIVDSMKNE